MKSARKHDTKSRYLAGSVCAGGHRASGGAPATAGAGEELKLSSHDMRERLAPSGQIGSHQSKGNISRVHGYQVSNEFQRRYFIFAYSNSRGHRRMNQKNRYEKQQDNDAG